ncbi:MAG TPA: aminopeptidase, partial [Bacilli bacterium]|nr:aminopeptidase [Bacilli bacterium]
MKDILLKEYAKLIVRIGANVQKDQIVVLNAPVEAHAFTKLVIEEAYQAGAKKVVVNWSYGEDNKLYYQYASEETLKEFPEYNVKRLEYFMVNKAAQISVGSPNPDLMKGVDPKKFVIASKAANEKIG